jgi:hypothetical protein
VATIGRQHRIWRWVAVASMLWFFQPLVATAWAAAATSSLLGLALRTSPRRGRRLLGVGFLGFAASCRLDFAAVSPLATLASFASQRSNHPDDRDHLAATVGVWLVGASPLLLNVVLLGLSGSVRTMIFEQAQIRPGRYLPMGQYITQAAFGEVIAASIVILTGLLAAWKVPALRGIWAFGGTARAWTILSVAALLQFLQRNDDWHANQALFLISPLAILVAGSALEAPSLGGISQSLQRLARGTSLVLSRSLLVLFLTLTTLSVAGRIQGDTPKSVRVCGQSYCTLLPPRDAPHVSAVVRAVSALSPEGVFVGPVDLRTAMFNDLFLYTLFAPARSCSYYIEMNPLAANGQSSRLEGDLKRCDVVVLSDRVNWYEPNASTRLGPEGPNDVIKREFSLVETHGHWAIYQRL